MVYQLYHGWLTLQLLLLGPPFCKERLNNCVIPPSLLVSYPDPTVRNDDHRLQYDITCHTVSDDHRYVHMGLGTRLPPFPPPSLPPQISRTKQPLQCTILCGLPTFLCPVTQFENKMQAICFFKRLPIYTETWVTNTDRNTSESVVLHARSAPVTAAMTHLHVPLYHIDRYSFQCALFAVLHHYCRQAR